MARAARRDGFHSRIADDGTYQPGKHGMVELRRRKAAQLFDRHPAVHGLFAGHAATWQFHEHQILRYSDRLTDGFRARFSRELLLIDARQDPKLRTFLQRLQGSLPAPAFSVDTADFVRVASRLVADVFGGPSDASLVPRLQARLDELSSPPPADTLLGDLFHGPAVGAPEQAGAGICRHRSLLLKYVCDTFRIADCAVLNGVVLPAGERDVHGYRKLTRDGDHMWCCCRVDGQPYLVDCMAFPGELLSAEDLLQPPSGPGAEDQQGFDSVCPSYHRIGGRAGIISLEFPSPATEQQCSAPGGRGASPLRPCLPENSRAAAARRSLGTLSGRQDAPMDAWLEVTRHSLELRGDVEVSSGTAAHRTCGRCHREIGGQAVRPSRCSHVFHVACILGCWEEGRCPVCSTSFVLPAGPGTSATPQLDTRGPSPWPLDDAHSGSATRVGVRPTKTM